MIQVELWTRSGQKNNMELDYCKIVFYIYHTYVESFSSSLRFAKLYRTHYKKKTNETYRKIKYVTLDILSMKKTKRVVGGLIS